MNTATAAPGLRSGNLELHPKFSMSGAYDSNFWRESVGDSTAPVNPTLLFLVDGGLALKTRKTSRFDFKGKLSVGMRQVYQILRIKQQVRLTMALVSAEHGKVLIDRLA